MDTSEAPFEPVQPEKKPRGCFFYGCLIVSVLTLLVCLTIGIAVYSGYRYYTRLVAEYTSTSPMALPRAELTPEAMADLEKRGDAFLKSAESDDPAPLILTADEINAKLAQKPEFKDRVRVEIPGDKLQGLVSMPLGDINLPGLKGRYLNGKALLRVHLANDVLGVYLDSLEVNGKPVPDQAMQSFRTKNLAEEFTKDPHNAEEIRKLESIEVRDGKVILKIRKKPRAVEDASKNDEATKPAADKDEAKPEGKDETKAEGKDQADRVKPENP